ncbi:helix-turn-helix domain-containing protein [Pseudomonas asuensis]|uniref:Transcriptional regulator n=1 Tax=Pseudomonas asuensis TaxID=1825787 RepID=A0ABQ2GX55_9PSED|nr:AraC family transcriptional regulator [Pseudomonas asuensis]GGM18147.1 transcriptional regulator [Pseudomonas asuensis]
MQQAADFQVFRTLDQASSACQLRHTALGNGMALAHWYRNDADVLGYSSPDHHTLSLYLEGGWRTFRRDLPGHYGAPDRFCVLPAGHDSDWSVTQGLGFMHLYVTPEQLMLEIVQVLDKEPRAICLQERTYMEDPMLVAICRTLERSNWQEPGERLLCSSLAQEAVNHMLLNGCGPRQQVNWRGGLSSPVRQRTLNYIHTYLDQPLELSTLSEEAALSAFHFSRMFTVSFGMPPHRYVLAKRLARARELLVTTNLSLAQITLDCGFSNASHLSRRFVQAHGATPGQYRTALSRKAC